MFKLITLFTFVFTSLLCQAQETTGIYKYSLETTMGLELINVKAEVEEHDGKKGIKVVKEIAGEVEGDGDLETLVVLPTINFRNGTIEIELSGELNPGAAESMRGFVGIAFRVDPKNYSDYECIYLRPTNARSNNQIRRNHSVQYVSHPEYPWYRLREESPKLYESYVDLAPAKWTSIKIVVKDEYAELFVNGADQPCLIINDLKHGVREGKIALWLHPSTLARYRNLIVTIGE
jgi:hypothetical protein